MFTSSVYFKFRDKIAFVLADTAAKALRNEIEYREICSLPKLTDALGISPTKMNEELLTLVGRGYVTVQDEIVFPTRKILLKHAAFQGLSAKEADAALARLRSSG